MRGTAAQVLTVHVQSTAIHVRGIRPVVCRAAMRLTLKLAAVLVALVLAVLAAEANLRLGYERREFTRDIEREQHLLGNALAPAVELALATRGLEAAERIVHRAEQAEQEVTIHLLDAAATGVHVSAEITETLEGQPGTVRTLVPVRSPAGAPPYLLALSESLAGTEQRLETSTLRILIAAILSLLAAGAAAMLVGDWLVGRPVRNLVQHAYQIAQGELPRPQYSKRRDEIGMLAEAMRNMVDGLATARRQAEEAATAKDQVERELRRSERLAAVGTLGAGLAHELGTPLQVVSGRARAIATDQAACPETRRHAEIIREQTLRMSRIVRQLLDFARAPVELPRSVSAESLLEEAAQLMRPTAEERNCHIVLRPATERTQVHVDVQQIVQVLTNVINNAIDAMPDGGTVTLSATRVAPKDGQAGYRARLEIADEGTGIPEEHLPHIFDPFYTTKPVGKGTGLGLSVAHGVIKEHGGDFDIKPVAPHGTRLAIHLPETDA